MTVALKLCRDCDRTDAQARFDRMSKHRCTECAGTIKQNRIARIQERGPRTIQAPTAQILMFAPVFIRRHLRWVRCLPCAVHGLECCGIKHAHHVRHSWNAGMGMKPGPEFVICLCAFHHSELHTIGAISFQAKHGIELDRAAAQTAAASPHIRRAA